MNKATIKMSELRAKTDAVRAEYRKELDAMAKSKERPAGLKKQPIEDLASGHMDGVRNAVTMLRAAGLFVVDDDA